MAGIDDYSPTPASNTALFPEGMAPSAVNDGMRQVQADIRSWYNDAEWVIYGDGEGAHAITFVSGTAFTINGADVTEEYHPGRRVKAVGPTMGTIYGTIESSSFATGTTVEVAWDSGSLVNENLTIYLGILRAKNLSYKAPMAAIADRAVTTAKIADGAVRSANIGANEVTKVKLAVEQQQPAGMVAPFAMSTPPEGWLECNGAAINRTTYADLFAAIGTRWGAGNGSTTFNLPDLRGEFIRGWDHGRGADTGRAFASFQSDAFKSHTHSLNYGASGSGPDTSIVVDTSSTAGSSQTGSAGSTETRPRNIALMYCIKT